MQILRWWVLAVLVLAGCTPAPAASTLPAASSGVAEATPTVSPTGSLATPSETPTDASLTDELVAVVTDDLVMRSQPGTGSDSEIYRARLNAPTIVYVIDGPEVADGYEWYLVDPLAMPCYFGCDFAPQAGWVAAAGKDGERWLAEEPASSRCPEPTLGGVAGAYPQLRLYCFGSEELTLAGGVVGVDHWQRPSWPWRYTNNLYGSDYEGPVPGCVDLCTVPLLTFAFDGDREPPDGKPASLSGHFDDARAAECRSVGIDVDQRVLTHECRKVFVVTSWK